MPGQSGGRKVINVAIKDSAENWVRSKPMQAIVLIAAAGIVLGGIVGLGAGWKIEQNRTKDDVKRLKAGGAAAASGTGALGQRVGKVSAVTEGTLTVVTKKAGSQAVHTTTLTTVEKATKGTPADIVVGRRVLLTLNGNDVIVLPAGSKLGRLVSNVTTDSFTVTKPSGARGAQIKTSNVKVVDTLSPAKLTDIKSGTLVLAGGRASDKSSFNATEVIVLPAGSAFAG
jgi:hypothetical protein